MAIVLALVIVGWLVAFALGAQAGFDSKPEVPQSATASSLQSNAASYQKTSAA